VHQARAPRLQISGHDNPDGWGVAWYPPESQAPCVYRTTTKIWEDETFPRTGDAPVMLAAARLASPPKTLDERNNAPFTAGPLAFSLNGYAFAGGRGEPLRAALRDERRDALQGDSDSEVLFGLLLDEIHHGAELAAAVQRVHARVAPDTTTRVNLLVTDGNQIVATAWGNSLWVQDAQDADAVLLASEPLDEGPDWEQVPDRALVCAESGRVTISRLEESNQ
jgi:glutamine amidotransferase